MPLTISTVRPEALSAAQLAAWNDLLATDPRYASPFFHPAYTRLISEVRSQVEVAVFEDGNEPVGFLPFERHHGHVARPLGVKLCDYQGVVMRAGVEWSPEHLMRESGLSVWHFDHLLAGDPAFDRYTLATEPSPYLDLSAGFEAYVAERRKAGSSQITQGRRKLRKLEREHGPVEFTWHDESAEALEKLIEWKAAQRQRTKTVNILKWDWVQQLLDRVRRCEESGFRGVLSTLRVNGKLAAVHLGMMTDGMFHYWFPTYDADYYRYSPGVNLLLAMAERCAEAGIPHFDLGKGDDSYKASFASAAETVAVGAVDLDPLRRVARSGWHHFRGFVKRSPLRTPAQIPKRLVQRVRARVAMGSAS